MPRLLALALACVATTAWAGEAAAQTDAASRGAARDLATAGVEAFQNNAFAEASQKLEKAYSVWRVPSLGLWSARALGKLGKLVQASTTADFDLLKAGMEVKKKSCAGGDQEFVLKCGGATSQPGTPVCNDECGASQATPCN